MEVCDRDVDSIGYRECLSSIGGKKLDDGAIYNSMIEASKATGILTSKISRACRITRYSLVVLNGGTLSS